MRSEVLDPLSSFLLQQSEYIPAQGSLRTSQALGCYRAWRDGQGLNYILKNIGLGALQSDWYTSEAGSMYAMALPAIWQMAGYVMALFLAGFRGIPDDLREAARVDGASEFKIYRHILFPQLSPTFLTVLIILGHISMKVFDLIFGIATKSYVTKVLAIYMWQTIFDFQNYAKGAAIAIVILLMIAVAVIPYLIYVNKTEEANK